MKIQFKKSVVENIDREIKNLVQMSVGTAEQMRKMVEKLESVNDELDVKRSQIDSIITDLEFAKSSLNFQQTDNRLIINNINNMFNPQKANKVVKAKKKKYERKLYEYNGESHSLYEWSKILNISKQTLYLRAQKTDDVSVIFRPLQNRSEGIDEKENIAV